jgi:hypothetical protein
MKRLFAIALTVTTTWLAMLSVSHARSSQSIAFYYGKVDRIESLALYDRVVVQPDQISIDQIKGLKNLGTAVYAYLSFSEYPLATLPPDLNEAVIGRNQAWQSGIMDLTHPSWQTYLLQSSEKLLKAGFSGLFLDTLDSYKLTPNAKRIGASQAKAATTMIQSMGTQFGKHIVLNRGFEILGSVHKSVRAVAAESIMKGYTPSQGYFTSPEGDTQWIMDKLTHARAKGLEIIAIDYVQNPKERPAVARQLINMGLTPYVSDGLLTSYGVSHITPVPNKVLALYDSTQHRIPRSPIFYWLGLPFERAGYPIAYHDLHDANLPENLSEYAAAIIWLPDHEITSTLEFAQWLARWKSTGQILWIDTPASPVVQSSLSFNYAAIEPNAKRQLWTFRDPDSLTGFESPLDAIRYSVSLTLTLGAADQKPILSIATADGEKAVLAKMPWGIAAAKHGLFTTDPFQDNRWLIDPKVLIHDLLELPVIPAADSTTETGRRIATAHIDGDGFPSRANLPGTPFTADVIHREILEVYTDIPTTVSVIEGEISAEGVHAKHAKELEAIAREIFSLPHVEIASHSFSHPFYWGEPPEGFSANYGKHLSIPNYTLDLKREVLGSLEYVNKRLTPPNKAAEVFLWSGYADPPESVISMAKQAGVENVNGGNTFVTAENFLLTNISPTVVPYASGIQVLAPVMNENIYTDLWSRNYGGYARAIETFKLLDQDERIKSIAIYYHMYSAEYPAALNALKSVYDWALKQDINPMRLSDYAKRARLGYDMALALKTQISDTDPPHWLIKSQGVTTVRLPKAITQGRQYEPWARADLGVAGWRQIHGDTYVHLSRKTATLMPKPRHDDLPYLRDSNGQILSWSAHTPESAVYQIQFKMRAHAPLELRFSNAARCALKYQNNSGSELTDPPIEQRKQQTIDKIQQKGDTLSEGGIAGNDWRWAKPHQSESADASKNRLITFYPDKTSLGLSGVLTCDL